MSQTQALSQFQITLDKANNCLYFVRAIRKCMVRLQERVNEEALPDTQDEESWELYQKRCKVLTNQIEELYNQIETLSHQLPDGMPPLESLSKIRNVFQEEQIDLHNMESIERMLDAENWNEANYQFFYYGNEFLRTGVRRKQSVMEKRAPQISTWAAHNSPHTCFEKSFLQVQKEWAAKKTGIWPTILERSAFGCIVEAKYGMMADRQSVVQQKMLFVENQGAIEMVLFIAPHEEWAYLDDWGGRKIDLTQQSRHLVYQKLTAQANMSLQILLSNLAPGWHPTQMQQVLQLFGRYQQVFEQRCRSCQKVMKDFLPCIMFDPRQPRSAFHETCR